MGRTSDRSRTCCASWCLDAVSFEAPTPGHWLTEVRTLLTGGMSLGRRTPMTLRGRLHQLQPLVLPQLGQAWQRAGPLHLDTALHAHRGVAVAHRRLGGLGRAATPPGW